MNADIITYLREKVEADIAMIETDLARGGAKDFADYKHACGTVNGLRKAQSMLLELERRMEMDDD